MKCLPLIILYRLCWSPSMRREWIEICRVMLCPVCQWVSLHAEGVD